MPTRNRIAVAIAVLAMSAASAGSAYAQQSYGAEIVLTDLGQTGIITMYDRPTAHYTVPVRLCGRQFFVTSKRNDAYWVAKVPERNVYRVTSQGKIICSSY